MSESEKLRRRVYGVAGAVVVATVCIGSLINSVDVVGLGLGASFITSGALLAGWLLGDAP